MTSRFHLVACDLDGTLLGTDEKLSDRTRAAVHRAIGDGAVFVYATGRPPRWVDPVVEQLDHYGYAVASNGAYVLDLSAPDHERIVERWEIQPAESSAAVDAVRSVLADVAFACDSVDAFGLDFGYIPKFGVPKDALREPIEVLVQRPWAKLLFRHPAMSPAVFEELVAAVGVVATLTFGSLADPDGLGVLPDPSTVVEILPFGMSKAEGLRHVCRRVCEHCGDGSSVVAFGDMPNDIEMLRWASHGVAMANAHHTVKAIADEVTLSNDDDGVAAVLEREFP